MNQFALWNKFSKTPLIPSSFSFSRSQFPTSSPSSERSEQVGKSITIREVIQLELVRPEKSVSLSLLSNPANGSLRLVFVPIPTLHFQRSAFFLQLQHLPQCRERSIKLVHLGGRGFHGHGILKLFPSCP